MMKTVNLPNGRATSRIGFGGTTLKGGAEKADNIKNLEKAFEMGILHYDVAPSYGLGVAEGILGEFIKNKRSQVTVTTKVGLARPKNPATLARLRSLVRPLVSFAPSLRRFLGRSVQQASGSSRTHFEMGHVRRSVEQSFRELGTDYVDVLLLHEITPNDVTDELRTYLDDLVSKGMVLNYGIGSFRNEAEATVRACPDIAKIVQTSWTVGDRALDLSPHYPFLFTHGAVRPMPKIKGWLAAKPEIQRALSAQIDADLSNPDELVRLMMAAALANNNDGIVLVSSTKATRLQEHINILEDRRLMDLGRHFGLAVNRFMYSD